VKQTDCLIIILILTLKHVVMLILLFELHIVTFYGANILKHNFFHSKDFKCCVKAPEPTGCFKDRQEYSLYLLSTDNGLRKLCKYIACQKWFDYTILFFIGFNCITLAMERPTIPPHSLVRTLFTFFSNCFQFNWIFSCRREKFSPTQTISSRSYLP